MEDKLNQIRIGFQVYLEEGGEECGAVRDVKPKGRSEIVVYVENGGEFAVGADALQTVHDGKVVLDCSRLDCRLLEAIAHAHDSEVPGL